MNNFLKNKKISKPFLGLFAVLVLVFVIRSYNFSEWLYFANDEARDAKVVRNMLTDGFEKAPLLGPKLGGTDAHLGPVYYYLLYFIGVVFQGAEPQFFAYFSFGMLLLLILLSYYFLTHFFDKKISFLATAVLAFSYVFAQYARFAWNPNTLPFWTVLFFLSLYKAFFSLDSSNKGRWLLLCALVYGVSGQLHVLALAGFPVVGIIFWFFHGTKINFRYWLGSLLVVLFLYLPLFVSDIKNNGENVNSFAKGFLEKNTEANSDKSFLPFHSFVKIFEESGRYFVLIVSSVNSNELRCPRFVSGAAILAGLFLIFYQYFNLRKERATGKSKEKEAFVFLTIVWFFVFFIINIPIADSLNKVRYWFLMTPAYLFFLALFLDQINKIKKIGGYLSLGSAIILIGLNLSAIDKWYASLEKKTEMRSYRQWSSRSFKFLDMITVGEMKKIIEEMIKEKKATNSDQVYFNINTSYRRAFEYIFDYYFKESWGLNYFELGKPFFGEGELKNALFFSILPTKFTESRVEEEIGDGYEIESSKNFGALTLWKLKIKN